ncbi:MAG: hypothetical protein DMD78_08230 [Candidatus Rokuibacteriota bacterium]|nr:MAG: hypothetical protein DMD78_08230 [Candidatus Rokubacteria bacterium]
MSGKQPRDTAWTMRAELSAPTPTAVWACRSRFCLARGPFWVKSLKDAQRDAARHRARRFLGLFGHDAVVRPGQGQSFLAFLRQMRLAPKAALT